MMRLATVCAMRSDTVGIPSFLVPPFAFGISTCFTGGGRYDPDDIRFHSLYKFLDRFCSNIAMVSSSMPAEPRLALSPRSHCFSKPDRSLAKPWAGSLWMLVSVKESVSNATCSILTRHVILWGIHLAR